MQGHINAIRLRGGDASFRLFEDAAHSFDRETPLEQWPDAAAATGAPTVYLDDAGAMVHPLSGEAVPGLTDRDLMLYAMRAGFGSKGATIGSKDDQPALFRADMKKFWKAALGLG